VESGKKKREKAGIGQVVTYRLKMEQIEDGYAESKTNSPQSISGHFRNLWDKDEKRQFEPAPQN